MLDFGCKEDFDRSGFWGNNEAVVLDAKLPICAIAGGLHLLLSAVTYLEGLDINHCVVNNFGI
jgi:hypothetical protein